MALFVDERPVFETRLSAQGMHLDMMDFAIRPQNLGVANLTSFFIAGVNYFSFEFTEDSVWILHCRFCPFIHLLQEKLMPTSDCIHPVGGCSRPLAVLEVEFANRLALCVGYDL
jgi:hypothetical protein